MSSAWSIVRALTVVAIGIISEFCMEMDVPVRFSFRNLIFFSTPRKDKLQTDLKARSPKCKERALR